MQSAITVSCVDEARRGPFVFHVGALSGGLDEACAAAAAAGFDAIELFPPGGTAAGFPGTELRRCLAAHGLGLAAVGTGAGWLRHGLCLTHPDAEHRGRALAFAADVVEAAGECGAPAIVGSMQGPAGGAAAGGRDDAVCRLADALAELAARAARHGQVLLYEPLNRYETDLFNRQADAAEFLRGRGIEGVRLACDLFHMNIEEADVAAAIVGCGDLVGHVHWADSNRRAVGFGHTDVAPVAAALGRIGYRGYCSAEVVPLPSAAAAAGQTIASLRRYAGSTGCGG